MNFEEELSIFAKSRTRFSGDDLANEVLGTVILARQLDPYILSSVDRGWVVRHTLDLGSGNLYSACRGTEVNQEPAKDPTVATEYRHSMKLRVMYYLLCKALRGEVITEEEANKHVFGASQKFYYGEPLTQFNHMLIQRVCPEVTLPDTH